ncbi:MAG: ribonuclease P protein component [Gemmobacter sp.]
MTPPETGQTGPETPPDAPLPPAVFRVPQTIARRADFLRAAAARRQGAPGFLLQARDRDDGDPATRIGYTCSRKVGNAVHRNRARRRLRAVARAVLPEHGRPGWDYVLVGRPEVTEARPFAALVEDLRLALTRIHAAPDRAAPTRPAPRGKRRGKGAPAPPP